MHMYIVLYSTMYMCIAHVHVNVPPVHGHENVHLHCQDKYMLVNTFMNMFARLQNCTYNIQCIFAIVSVRCTMFV